ncbi:HAMP domain-containing histidine kinase [Sulfurimonas sp. SAG-AH-194-I05]|nr:HAMP domain-containing sensor histidine kinase [Sulfurimonas sp. SAG-AH-194-I05]MDF1874464.1 HAMP domain-containing histidine kinase [Sulfurimonas sp. SAG-AH-194-I05]
MQHERIAFLKFFLIYFLSVALLILISSFFYFSQTQEHYLKEEEFSLIEYARHLKMGDGTKVFPKEYHHIFVYSSTHIDMDNFIRNHQEFNKLIPTINPRKYIKVSKSKKLFDSRVSQLKKQLIIGNIVLLLFFAFISYKLAINALKPLKESIIKLDKFAKDLIHDLNTPVTSIKLNMKLLEKVSLLEDNKAIIRLNKSVHTISELHENLTILLEEETFQMQSLDICTIIHDVIQIQKQIHPDILFHVTCQHLKVKLNQNATKQILQNIISNACKYNIKNGSIHIYTKEKSLYIQDEGAGIQNPHKIFERSFSDKNSSGIGLDIVKRLAKAMHIKINVSSSSKGSIFELLFK